MLNMRRYGDQRVAILVDVQNMYYSAKNLYNSKVNFEEIISVALNNRLLSRAMAYTIKAEVKDERIFHEALEKIGFEVKTKDLLVFHGGNKKGDWDVGIAMDAVRMAEKVDTIIVVSGDGDFKEMYEYVRGKGCRVEVLAFGRTASSSIKDYVDRFVDMDKNKKFLIPIGNKGNSNTNTSSNNRNNNNQRSTNNNRRQVRDAPRLRKDFNPAEYTQENKTEEKENTKEYDLTAINDDQPKADQKKETKKESKKEEKKTVTKKKVTKKKAAKETKTKKKGLLDRIMKKE